MKSELSTEDIIKKKTRQLQEFQAIIKTIETPGWKYIVSYLKGQIKKNSDVSKINLKKVGLTDANLAFLVREKRSIVDVYRSLIGRFNSGKMKTMQTAANKTLKELIKDVPRTN